MVETSDSANPLESRWLLWAIGVLAAILFLTTNLPWHLDDYDQAKQAFTSYEMVKQGHWLYQHTPRERLATKPPLVGWISAAVYEVTRSWNVAWRLPSLLSAAAIALLIGWNAKKAFGHVAAVIGVSAFSFNLLTPRLATLVRTDMPLALIICAIGVLIWRHVQWSRPWETRERWLILLLLTAGTLIKGPIVYAFLLPGLILFQFWRRKSDPHYEWPGWWPWIASVVFFLVWGICGSRFVPGFHDQVVLHEFLGRFSETEHQPKPFYFYLPHLLQKFGPWSILILFIAGVRWRKREQLKAEVTNPGMSWLVCWIVGGLLVMSLVPSKRVDRIYPVVPPLCLLLAAQLAASWPNDWRRLLQRGAVAFLAVALIYASGYGAYKVVNACQHHRDSLVGFGHEVRARAMEKQWHYAVIYGGDEGMVMYLDLPGFTEKNSAVADWNSGKLDALVAPAGDLADYERALQPAPTVSIRSLPRGGDKPDYVLLARTPP